MLRVLVIMLLVSANAFAADYKAMKTVGKGELSWMFWTAYEAELLSDNGEYSPDKPFALKLVYNMDFTGNDIAQRSAEEIIAQKVAAKDDIDKWLVEMNNIFSDVKNGDSITGVRNESGESLFLHNGEEIGRINDPEFTKAFFGIWLSEKTSEPELRAQLLAGQ